MAIPAVLSLLLVIQSGSPVSKQNAAADAVVELSRPLGIDFNEGIEKAAHPAETDTTAHEQAGASAWLRKQIEDDTDEVGEPPAALKAFLRDRRDAIWNVVAALEKGAPEWEPRGLTETGPLLPVMRLERLLIADALAEEREGNRIDAARAMDASWSLGRAFAGESTQMSQILATAVEKLQLGALRKMREPQLQWQGRLETDGPWNRMLTAIAKEGRFRGNETGPGAEIWEEIAVKAVVALTDSARRVGPCVASSMSDEELWKPAVQALSAESSEEKRAVRDVYGEMMGSLFANGLRRAARIEVDRELTLKILRLRLEKDGSADGRWPEALVDATSAICPDASYAYRANSTGIELRFEGSIAEPSMGALLPLVFRSRAAAPTPTSTPTPPVSTTPTPLTAPAEGGMIPPR